MTKLDASGELPEQRPIDARQLREHEHDRLLALADHRHRVLALERRLDPGIAQPERDLGCLRLCTSAGEALPIDLHQRWLETFGVEVLDGIGSSEAYHIYISNRPGAARPGTLGQVVPGYTAPVLDPDGRELPAGETGRLAIEGDTAALMYWNARRQMFFSGT